MKKNCLFLLVLLFPFFLLSQTENNKSRKEIRKARDKYWVTSLGGTFVKSADNATSPLQYKGFAPSAGLSYLVHSTKVINVFETDFSYGWLKARTISPWYQQKTTNIIFNVRYYKLYMVKPIIKNRVNWYLGGEVFINSSFRVNIKYGNSAFTFNSYAGIGPVTRFEFPFGYKTRKVKIWFMKFNRRDRNLRLSFQLSVPVLNVLVRPTYITVTNFIDPDLQSAITSDHIYSGFFEPFSLSTQTELYYILHNQNMLKLSYNWNFFHHDPGYNKVQTASHAILFSYIFKFNLKNAGHEK